jgi:radical SAM superfamily enzyme YgiQ (UPF0313 family)
VALEHGDPEMLQIMNKKLDLERAFQVLRLLVKHRIPTIVLYIIVGYPGETKRRFDNSLAFLKRVRRLGGNIQVCVNIAQPYPGTRLAERCINEGIISDPNFNNFLLRQKLMSTSHTVSIETGDFDAQEVLKRKAKIRWIFAPNPFFRTAMRAILPQSLIDHFKKGRTILAGMRQH